MTTAVFIKDLGVYRVELDNRYSKKYYYNNAPVTVDKFECRDLDALEYETKITITKYLHIPTNTQYTPEEYSKALQPFLKNYSRAENLHEDEDGKFATLEDEYAYKKELENWERVTYEVASERKKAEVEITTCVYSTGNRFIECNGFLDSNHYQARNFATYCYYRQSAILHIVQETFNSLGMTFVPDPDYKDTANHKIWGYPNHSGIKYTTAFGGYLFNDQDGREYGSRLGTLEDMLEQYAADEKYYSEKIKKAYTLHFNKFDASDYSKAFADSKQNLERAVDSLRGLYPRAKKDRDSIHSARKYLNYVLDEVEKVIQAKQAAKP